MTRKSRMMVLACLLIPTGLAATAELATRAEAHLGSGPARIDCYGAWCSSGLAGIAAMASAALSLRPDGGVAHGNDLALVMAPVTLAEPATQTRLQIQIGSRDPLPKNTLIRLRGLPAAVSIPQGHQVADGVWAVSVRALSELSLVVPHGLLGGSDVSVTLVTTEGEVLAQSKTRLQFAQL